MFKSENWGSSHVSTRSPFFGSIHASKLECIFLNLHKSYNDCRLIPLFFKTHQDWWARCCLVELACCHLNPLLSRDILNLKIVGLLSSQCHAFKTLTKIGMSRLLSSPFPQKLKD
ncbi:hypothetical protein TNCV_409631 [Trichonephila clavipes]|nr:hypothetical protein TNCV_409631 [Trichonephila clavipes]